MIDPINGGFVPDLTDNGYAADGYSVFVSNHAIDRVSQRFLDEFRRETGNGQTMGIATWMVEKVREAYRLNNINKRGHYLIDGMILVIKIRGNCLTLATVLYP